MAQAILKPAVSDFIESTIHDYSFKLNIEEIMVGENSQLNSFPWLTLALDRKWTLSLLE